MIGAWHVNTRVSVGACYARARGCLLKFRLLYFAVYVLLLTGCAAQNAYREGLELANAGNPPQALEKFEEAARLDSSSAQYRIAAIRARESLVQESLNSAQRAFIAEDHEAARQAFNRALAYQPLNARALDGLKALESAARHDKWLRLAQSAQSLKDLTNAQTWLRMVIAEDPGNRKAIAMQRSMEDLAEKLPVATGLAESYRKAITIEFRDAPLKAVFEVISRTSGLNFLFDKDVKTDQKTSIFLRNSSIEAVVNLTLLTNQLEQRVIDGNTVLIYPNTQAKQKDYQPLSVKSFYLVNGEAKNVANTLKTILKSRDVVVDEKLNMIILRDSPEAIRLAEKLVALHDIQDSEVMLEVEILEVKRTRLLDLGIRWPDQLGLSPIAGSSGTLTLADLRGLNSDTLGVTVGSTTISAKKQDSDTNILANPRIRVRNREKAKILIGDRVPTISSTATATGFVSESVTYVDVGLKLDVEPTIYLDGEVSIKVALEVSNVVSQLQTQSGSVAYQIGTRNAQTVLRLKDGENQVLAGLINDEDRRTANKVPGLGEVPLVGRLFGGQADDTSKTEIVLSITPRIVRTVQRPGNSVTEFESGTETSLVNRASGSPPAHKAASPTAPPDGKSQSPAIRSSTDTVAVNEVPATTTPQVRWRGPAQLKVGDAMALQLVMQSEQPLVNLPMAVQFDSSVLQATSVVEGDFLKQNNASTSFTSRIDPSGQILITGSRAGDSGATGSGTIATVNFKVIGAGKPQTSVQLLTMSPIATGGRGLNAALPAPHVVSVAP